MYKLNKVAVESTVEVMAAQSDGGGYYGRTAGGWMTGTKAQLVKAGARGIQKTHVRIERKELNTRA